jgi:DNA helicase II / ATP-dependent DNA helicase PcrA
MRENFKAKTIAELYNSYEKTLKANNAMDFDDLILRTVQLFSKDKEIRYSTSKINSIT